MCHTWFTSLSVASSMVKGPRKPAHLFWPARPRVTFGEKASDSPCPTARESPSAKVVGPLTEGLCLDI